MNTLYIDTETSGFWAFGLPPTHPSQPHLLQLAALLYDPSGRTVGAVSALVKPDGWAIEARATLVHGITQAMAESIGQPLTTPLRVLHNLIAAAGVIVAHNLPFDWGVLQRAYDTCGWTLTPPASGVCTMRSATGLVPTPPRADGSQKWPSLSEAYEHITGRPIPRAHDALHDVAACRRIHQWLVEQSASLAEVPLK